MLPFLVPQAQAPVPSPLPLPLPDATRDALLEVLADGRKAEATYAAVLARFGPVEPFLSIVEAERCDREVLLDLFRIHNVEIPPNPHQNAPLSAPPTLPEACASGVKIEEAAIAMFDRLLSQIRERDVRMVFRQLQEASRSHHLPAFRACARP
jgi:hypothetical protein